MKNVRSLFSTKIFLGVLLLCIGMAVTPVRAEVNYQLWDVSLQALPDYTTLGEPTEVGTLPNFTDGPRDGQDQFYFRYTAALTVTTSGEYTFYTASDDGSRLYIGDWMAGTEVMIVDNDGLHGTQEQSGTITLTAGVHGIVVEFFEQGGGDVIEVRWEGPGISKDFIPDASLGIHLLPRAMNPTPEDNAELVELDTQLMWESPPLDESPTYTVYFGTDANAHLNPSQEGVTDTTFDPTQLLPNPAEGLQYETVYTWAVDTVVDNDGTPETIRGFQWSFTTTTEKPIIEQQPEPLQRKYLGEDVSLSIVVNDQTSTYEWVLYDPNTDTETALTDGDRISGVTTDTLTITGLTKDDFFSYRCYATNASGTTMSESGAVVEKKLILHYALDGDTTDSSDTGRDGVFGGTAAAVYVSAAPEINGVTLDLGQALDLDGVDQHVETSLVASDLDYAGGDTPRTVESWVYTRSFNNGAPWDMGDRSSGNNFCLRTLGSLNRWRIQYWGGDQDHTIVTENQWVQLILTYDGAGITNLYANGALVGTFDRVIDTTDGRTLKLGAYGRNEDANPGEEGGDYFDGLIADVKFFDYDKSATEIALEWTAIFGGNICVGGNPPLDLNGDCIVNSLDFQIFANDWMLSNLVP